MSVVKKKNSNSSQITFPILQQHFHLPINQVAKELGVCATVLKKICRQHGIPRWPHRKIKSLNKKIAVLEEQVTTTEEEENERLSELRSLKRTKAEIIENPACIGPTYSHINPGKPAVPIQKYGGRRASHENLLREQSVRAILQRQRKYSAPDPSFNTNLQDKFKHIIIQQENANKPVTASPMSTSTYYAKDFAPKIPTEPFIRSSCPAVLEGLSTEQLDILNSINTESNYPYTLDSNDNNDSHEYSLGYPPIQSTNSNFNSFNTLPVTPSPSSSSNSNYEFISQQQRDYFETHQNSPPNLAPFTHYDNNQNQSHYNNQNQSHYNNQNQSHYDNNQKQSHYNNQNQSHYNNNQNQSHYNNQSQAHNSNNAPPIHINNSSNSNFEHFYPETRHTTLPPPPPPPIKVDYEMNQLPTLYQDLRNTRNSMNYKVIAPHSSNSTTP